MHFILVQCFEVQLHTRRTCKSPALRILATQLYSHVCTYAHTHSYSVVNKGVAGLATPLFAWVLWKFVDDVLPARRRRVWKSHQRDRRRSSNVSATHEADPRDCVRYLICVHPMAHFHRSSPLRTRNRCCFPSVDSQRCQHTWKASRARQFGAYGWLRSLSLLLRTNRVPRSWYEQRLLWGMYYLLTIYSTSNVGWNIY